MSLEKSIVWRRADKIGAGHEYIRIYSADSKCFLEGTAIFVDRNKFCKLDYKIICGENWETSVAQVSGFVGDEKIEIEIQVDAEKRWTLNGKEISVVKNCVDVDLNFSPVTNLLPIRRLNLAIGQKEEVRAAWLKFPSFRLEPLVQTYERTGENSCIYESAGGAFRAKIETDESGLVADYENLWRIEN